MTTVGIIGAGNIGAALAEGLVAQGHQVVLSNSRGPETLTELVTRLGPAARAASVDEAAELGEYVIVTIPLKAIDTVPVAPLAGKVVLDTNNYYWERDGRIAILDEKGATTSGLLQERLPESVVVKAFNHIPSAQILLDGSPADNPDRVALATATDSPQGLELVTAVYDAFGYDTVNVGPLADSWRVERDQPAYTHPQTAAELAATLPLATR